MIGLTFGKLTVIAKDSVVNEKRRWRCRCECGNETIVPTGALRSGNTKSCGCLKVQAAITNGHANATHGARHTPEWDAWQSMKQRCFNHRHPEYDRYGGRGITVCDRWLRFENFLADVGAKPSPEYSLDRYPNNDGNYEPGNVRWATDEEQLRNTSVNVRLSFQGETLTVVEWAERTGIPANTLYQRVEAGWTPERMLTTKPRSSWRKRGPYSEAHRKALSAGQIRRREKERLVIK